MHKVYVQVNADHLPDGVCTPRSIVYQGRTFAVDRICGSCRAASTRVGGTGIRYTVRIGGREVDLFDEENGRWFMEKK